LDGRQAATSISADGMDFILPLQAPGRPGRAARYGSGPGRPGAVRALVDLVTAAQQAHEGHSVPLGVEVGTEIYAYRPGPVRLGTVIADVVCIGSPIWIGSVTA
jgi:hypothetical protein